MKSKLSELKVLLSKILTNSEVKFMVDRKYIFKNEVAYLKDKKGTLTCKEKHKIDFTTLPDFGGQKDMLTPEDLFVGSVNSCTLTTFLYFAERLKLTFLSFTCTAEGLVNRNQEGLFVFSEISVKPVITVKNDEEKNKAIKAVELTERHCWISKSIDNQIKVKLQPTIRCE